MNTSICGQGRTGPTTVAATKPKAWLWKVSRGSTCPPQTTCPYPAEHGAATTPLGPTHLVSLVLTPSELVTCTGEVPDRVTARGTAAGDRFTALAGLLTTVQVGDIKSLTVPQASTEVVGMLGSDGTDVFDVTTYDTLSTVFAAYGDSPSAKRFSDTLVLRDRSRKAQFRDVKGHIFETGSAFASYVWPPPCRAAVRAAVTAPVRPG